MQMPRAEERPSDHSSRRSSRVAGAVAVLCVAFLSYVAGSFTMDQMIYPAGHLHRAFQGGTALYDRLTGYNDPVQTAFWNPARTESRGVVRHDRGRAQQGLTLYTSAHEQRAFLTDMDGRVVYQWVLPYSKVWDKTAAVQRPLQDPFIHMENAHVFPNGDLLAVYTAVGDTPWGYGLVKMDRDSKVIWKYLARAHHDFDIDANGNIYVLTHTIADTDLPGFPDLRKPRVDDFLVKLSPDGKELQKVWLAGAFARSPYGRRMRLVPWDVHARSGDYLHTNSVHILKRPIRGVPQSRPGQILVSFREVSSIGLIDMKTGSLVWARSGPWVRQHDPEVLANGNILLFDNEGGLGDHGSSRVIEFDVARQGVVWRYGGGPDEPLESVTRSSQSRLANGNTLIVESEAGRILEVTPDGAVVWEVVNPVRGGEKNDRIPVIHWAERLDPKRYFTPDFRARLDSS